MTPHQKSLLEMWLDEPMTISLLQHLVRQRQIILPERMLVARKLQQPEKISDLLAELEVTKNLEDAVRSGNFLAPAKNE